MCGLTGISDCGEQIVGNAVGDAIEKLATAVQEMFGKTVASLGTMWVYVGTPNLTDSGGSSPIRPGSSAPDSANITTILGYVTWIGLVVAAAAIIWMGILVAASLRRGEGAFNVGRLGLILGGVVLISGASSLVTGLLPAGPRGAGGATLFIQSTLWWYMGGLAVLSVVVAGIRMAWENRAEPARDLVKSLFTLIAVAGSAVTFTQLFITASDSFAVWVLQGSLKCNVGTDSACFGKSITTLLSLGGATGSGGLGAMLVIVLGLVASLAAFVQIVLMVARSGMLVILAGILPLSAAATNTEMGKNWFRKCLGWLIAFLLYKPAAAIVYATAFQLVGSNVFASKDAVVTILTGLMLMILAVLAMPALMRFVTPLVGSLAGGAAGGALVAGTMAALPTGAAQLGRLGAGAGSNTATSSTSSQPTGATPNAGNSGGGQAGQGSGSSADGAAGTAGQSTPAPSGASSTSGSSGSSGPTGSPGASGNANAPGAAAAGAGGSGTQAAAQAAQSGTAGAGAGAAGSGAAAAGAAAGPAGVAAGAAVQAAGQVAGAAQSAAKGAAEDSTGEGAQ